MDYVVEPGTFKVWIGPNAAEGLEGAFGVMSSVGARMTAQSRQRQVAGLGESSGCGAQPGAGPRAAGTLWDEKTALVGVHPPYGGC